MRSLSKTVAKCCLIILLCLQLPAGAQSGLRSETKEITEILQREFEKTKVAPKIHFTNNKNESGFFIELINQQQLEKYGLSDKPNGSFYLKVTEHSAHIASLSIDGLRNGAYWYLQYIGFRYYFPEQSWWFVPSLKTPYKPVEKVLSPSFLSRRIWYAYGTDSKKADEDYRIWTQANLLGGDEINAGHAYEAIVNRNKKVFLEHPEYFAQKTAKGTIPKNPKFEVSNKALVQLCIDDALGQVENYVKKHGRIPTSISMDPSDGGGFSTSDAALKIGGPSEQVFYLANQVAKSMRNKFPSVLVGLYAYNFHAAPPEFELEPNIVVLIATAYNQSKFPVNQLVELWKEKKVRIGIRDYFGVLVWDWDMPGQVRGSKTAYVKQIKNFQESGALYFSAETNIGWISRGLGHYLATKLLWDVNANIEQSKAEFFKLMFGKGSGEIEKLYDSWEQYRQPTPMDGNLVEWYNFVNCAASLESSQEVRTRLNQIKQYLYYIFLFKVWKEDSNDDNLNKLLNFAYRVQSTGVLSSYPLFRTLANAAVAGKEHMRFNDPDAKWKQNKSPVSEQEINDNLKNAIASLNIREKAGNTKWPENFLSSKKEKAKEEINSSKTIKLRGGHKIIFNIAENKTAAINLAAGFIKAHDSRPLIVKIYKYTKDFTQNSKEVILNSIIEAKQPLKSISLSTLKPGTYLAVIDDSKGGFLMSFTGIAAYGIIADNESMIWTLNRSNLYFEVKQGLKDFILQTDGVLTLKSPTGRIIDFQSKQHPLTNIVKVEDGEQGIWQVLNQSGRMWIQGPTPILNPEENLLLRSSIN